MDKEKPNCYKCKFRGGIAGSCHSSCRHPSVGKIGNNPMVAMMGMLASVGRVSPFQVGADKLNIKGNPHGVRNGWFIWPVNFDPVWLENCDGFECKE